MYTRSPRIFRKENKSINSYIPTGIKRIFLTISEVPWAGLIALSTIWGSFTLFMYFKSVDAWVVSDIPTMLKIAGGATVVSLVYLPVLGGLLISPGLLAKQYQDMNKQFKINDAIPLDEIVFGMLSVISLGSVVSLWGFFDKSDSVEFLFLCIFLCLCLFSFASLVYNLFQLLQYGLSIILARVIMFFGLGIVFAVPFLMYVLIIEGSLGKLFVNNEVMSELAPFLLGIGLLVSFNCFVFLGDNIPRAVMVSAALLVFYAEAALPLIVQKVSPFSVVTASVLEIRTSTPVNLVVPKSTCELIRRSILDARDEVVDSKIKSILIKKKCTVEMNSVNAQILSNVGESWRVKVFDVFDEVSLFPYSITLSIPHKGIHYPNIRFEFKK